MPAVRGEGTKKGKTAGWKPALRNGATRLAPVAHASESLWLGHGVCCRGAGNQPRAPAERQILESPLNKDLHAALELHDVHQMDEQPDQPRGPSGNVQSKNVCHC